MSVKVFLGGFVFINIYHKTVNANRTRRIYYVDFRRLHPNVPSRGQSPHGGQKMAFFLRDSKPYMCSTHPPKEPPLLPWGFLVFAVFLSCYPPHFCLQALNCRSLAFRLLHCVVVKVFSAFFCLISCVAFLLKKSTGCMFLACQCCFLLVSFRASVQFACCYQ